MIQLLNAVDNKEPSMIAQNTFLTDFITDYDLYLLKEGKHLQMYNKLGAQLTQNMEGVAGVHFCVWAPNAQFVGVMGDFNGWDKHTHPMFNLKESGYWVAFVPHLKQGDAYKYYIQSSATFYEVEKADPMGFYAEMRPCTGSRVWDVESYQWNDK